MRFVIKLLATVCITMLLLLVGMAIWLYWDLERSSRSQPPQPPLPVLLRGLDGDVDKSRRQFAVRVRQRFAPGTDATALRLALQRDGFSIHHQDQLEWAAFDEPGPICARYWTISWRKDSEDKSNDIQSNYYVTCL